MNAFIEGLTSAVYTWSFLDKEGVYVLSCLALLIFISLFISFLTRQQRWIDFCKQKKWLSRSVLTLLSLILVTLLGVVPSSLVINHLPGKIAMESPNLTVTAIKVGVFGLAEDHEMKQGLSPEKQDLYSCVKSFSVLEGKKLWEQCSEKPSCKDDYQAMTRAQLIDKIKEYSSSLAQCKKVDVTKL